MADGPMLKYHGQKLEQYILTLMQIVRLKIFTFTQVMQARSLPPGVGGV